MRHAIRGALQSFAIMAGVAAFGLVWACCHAPHTRTAHCASVYDPDMCAVDRDDDDAPLPPLPCGVPCDTDTRCADQAALCGEVGTAI